MPPSKKRRRTTKKKDYTDIKQNVNLSHRQIIKDFLENNIWSNICWFTSAGVDKNLQTFKRRHPTNCNIHLTMSKYKIRKEQTNSFK